MSKWWILAAAVAILCCAVLTMRIAQQLRHHRELTAIDDPSTLDNLHLQIAEIEPTDWVERWQPNRASNGYTLVLYQRRVPMLIDMAGRVVHTWPRVRAVGRARLNREGRLLVIGTDDLIKVYDWSGHLQWFHRLPEQDDFPHHDVIWTQEGNAMVLARDRDDRCDYIREVSSSGKVLWEWRAADHLDAAFPDWDRESRDPTHLNSIQELPANQWYDGGDERFRPRNILVSGRHLNTVFVIEKNTGDVVWKYDRRLDNQHEAVMIPKGRLGGGLILLFNNGLENLYEYRRSAVLAIDPSNDSVVWSYRHRYFYTSTAGVQQPLPNGNLLVTSSRGGRVFEITPDGEIVWQWIPPFFPMRPERYPHDYCRQTAEIEPAPKEAIPSRLGRPFVDDELHNFAVVGEYKTRSIDGRATQVVGNKLECRELIVPPRPTVRLGYGLDLPSLADANVTARFRFTIRSANSAEEQVLLDDVVTSDSDELWRNRRLALQWPPYRQVEFCKEARVTGDVKPHRARRIAAVANPVIESRDRPRLPRRLRSRKLTDQELALREQQLKALGYAD